MSFRLGEFSEIIKRIKSFKRSKIIISNQYWSTLRNSPITLLTYKAKELLENFFADNAWDGVFEYYNGTEINTENYLKVISSLKYYPLKNLVDTLRLEI